MSTTRLIRSSLNTVVSVFSRRMRGGPGDEDEEAAVQATGHVNPAGPEVESETDVRSDPPPPKVPDHAAVARGGHVVGAVQTAPATAAVKPPPTPHGHTQYNNHSNRNNHSNHKNRYVQAQRPLPSASVNATLA